MRLALLLLLMGCAPGHEEISESDVIRTVEGLFEALDAENTNPRLLDRYITRDFMIYEAGQKMTREEFVEMVNQASLLETDWELSDFRVSTDEHSAHVSLLNEGDFVVQADSVKVRLKYRWLESAYLVREGDSLKIKFYFSDNIGRQSDTLN